MYYYYIDYEIVRPSSVPLNRLNGYKDDMQLLTEEQYNFALANPKAYLDEILAMEITHSAKTLAQHKIEKKQAILDAFNYNVSNGYYDQTLGITIRIADEDRNQFNQRITLINLIPNEMKPATTTITDINGEPITLTLQEFFTLMLYMGMYYDSLWGKKANLDKQINDATTVEEIENINWE